MNYLNKDDYDEQFWCNNYKITVSSQGIIYIVNADCAQDAIDIVIDHCEKEAPGLLWSRDEENEWEMDDYICGGNHCRYLSTHNVRIEQI